MSRRRGNSNSITLIYWRDIPAQITASHDGVTEKALLEPRFQHAIDRAAAVAGLTEAESYVAQWRRVSSPLASDPVQAASKAVTQFNDDYPRERLEQLVAQGGAELETAAVATTEAKHD